jgi:antitoxin VapB
VDRKAKVFVTGGSQAVRLPIQFRFHTTEVYVRRDESTGDVILSTRPEKKPLREIFAMLDAAGAPEDFMADRDMTVLKEREGL